MQAAIKKLPVSAILLGILGGIIGIGAGLFLGFALGSALAAALHVSTFEGEAGYFAVAIALIVAVIVTPSAILLTLYWRGIRGLWPFRRVDHCVSLDRCHRCIGLRTLVHGSATCSEFERANAAA